MPYIVLFACVAIQFVIWAIFFNTRAKSYKRIADLQESDDASAIVIRHDLSKDLMKSILATALCLFAAWGWGISGIQEQQALSASEEQWFQEFNDRHRDAWEETCDYIFFQENTSGVLFRDAQPYTVQWCNSLWSPPSRPEKYSLNEIDQPESQEPFASVAVFGPSTMDYSYCSNADDEDSCMTWYDLVVPPISY